MSQEGVEYHFVSEETLQCLEQEGRVVELRAYDTVCGVWKYFTVCDEHMNLEKESYAVIGTLESWNAMKRYFGDQVMDSGLCWKWKTGKDSPVRW